MFLDTVQKYPVVWNSRLKEYSKKPLRDAHIQLILKDLAKKGIHMDDDEFRLRLKNIKDTYRVELNKVNKSMKSGGDKIYIPKLSWFNMADLFLRDVTNLRELRLQKKRQSTVTSDEPSRLIDNGFSQDTTGEQMCASKDNGLKRNHDDMVEEAYNVLKRLASNTRNTDEFDIFGKHVACSIRNLESDFVRSTVKFHINNILFQAETGQFDPDRSPDGSEKPTSSTYILLTDEDSDT